MTHHDAGAGPAHGPAHRGDLSSPEPGGFDEFDHGPGPGGDAATDATPGAAAEGDAGLAERPLTTEPITPDAARAEPDPVDEAESPADTRDGSDGTAGEDDAAGPGSGDDPAGPVSEPAYGLSETTEAALAAERLEDLRRLQAEYVNYKKRVDRDRALAREQGIGYTLEALLPVLDDIHMAREHGELQEGPFAAIAEKLESVLSRLGIERFGMPGEQFDPMCHEALMHVQADLDPSATTTTVVQVLQPGYRLGDRVVRAARVAVADPQ